MASKEVSAALWKKLKPLMPEPAPRSAKGGRPRVDDQSGP
jgi:transposase